MARAVRVILVEDNDVYRASLELLLGMQEGIEVVSAVATGTEALEVLATRPSDVALVDFRLDGTDGAELAARIRQVEPGTAVLCLTAEASAEERDAVRRAGAVAVIEKGAPIDDLVRAIRDAAAFDPG